MDAAYEQLKRAGFIKETDFSSKIFIQLETLNPKTQSAPVQKSTKLYFNFESNKWVRNKEASDKIAYNVFMNDFNNNLEVFKSWSSEDVPPENIFEITTIAISLDKKSTQSEYVRARDIVKRYFGENIDITQSLLFFNYKHLHLNRKEYDSKPIYKSFIEQAFKYLTYFRTNSLEHSLFKKQYVTNLQSFAVMVVAFQTLIEPTNVPKTNESFEQWLNRAHPNDTDLTSVNKLKSYFEENIIQN